MGSYLELAAKLKDELVKSEGFIRAERFSSLVNEGPFLIKRKSENENLWSVRL